MHKVNEIVTIYTGDLAGQKCKITKVTTSTRGEVTYCGYLVNRGIRVCELRESDLNGDCVSNAGVGSSHDAEAPQRSWNTGDEKVDAILNASTPCSEYIGRPTRNLSF